MSISNESTRLKVEVEQLKRRVDELKDVNLKVSEYESRVALISQEVNRLNEKVALK